MTPQAGFDHAQFVFTGKVVQAEHHVWLVDVERVWKGREKLRRTVKLMDVFARMDCEFYFELGQRYLFFAVLAKGSREVFFHPQACNWTRPLQSTRVLGPDNESLWVEDLIVREHGPGEAPTLAAAPVPPKLVVLDVEITGDLGGDELAAEHEARLSLTSSRLRESLAHTGLYQLVDSTPAESTIDELKSRYRYLHDCNGCDLDIARQLGAEQILVAWVNRVSALILSFTYEIHDVATGQIIARKSFGFRGDNDTSWTHAIDCMVRDLNESAPTGRIRSLPTARR